MHSRPDTLIPDGADASIYAGASPDTSRQPQPAAGAMTDAEMSSSLEGTDAERIASDKRSKILREMVAKSLRGTHDCGDSAANSPARRRI